ncbi:hypothetical protein Ndes2526B_g01041 [Nannochloris sp. 'desiccata']|nr:hypothetical protein KSW81_002142 [Chlorella desiccata (nom. nud.)]KAH7623794.1 hypothetical protein NADE_008612 [Chlorella desiccata (nom. nud.)]
MVASGVTPEARDQAIAVLRQTLRQTCDEAKADARARIIESKAYDTCSNYEEWNLNIEKTRRVILIKIEQRNAVQRQQQHQISMGYSQPPQMQQQMAQTHYQQQPMMMMTHHQMQQQPMHPVAPYPQSQQQQQQQGWVQATYGHHMMPPHQQQHMSMMASVNGISPQSHTSSVATTAGWGAPPPLSQPQPHPHQVVLQNNYPPHVSPPIAMEPPVAISQTPPSQVPQVLPPSQISQAAPQAQRHHAQSKFRKLQLVARETLLKDAKKVAQFASTAAAKAHSLPDQNTKMLLKAISYIELEDFSNLEISPDKVSKFALLLESTKAMIENVRAEMHKKRATATAAVEASPAPPSQPKQELPPSAQDPTEKLLQMLQPKASQAIVFPSGVAACLKNQLEKKQAFPLPKLNSF